MSGEDTALTKAMVRPGADQVPGGPLAQHGADGVNDDGLTRAGLAGQGIEAGPEGDVRPLDDGDILNMEQIPASAYPSVLRLSSQRSISLMLVGEAPRRSHCHAA